MRNRFFVLIHLLILFCCVNNLYADWTITVEDTGKGGELKISWQRPSGDVEGEIKSANYYEIFEIVDYRWIKIYDISSSANEITYYRTGLTNNLRYEIGVIAEYFDGERYWGIASAIGEGMPTDVQSPSIPGVPIHSDTDSGYDGVEPDSGWDDDTELEFSWTAGSDTNTDPKGSISYDYVVYRYNPSISDWDEVSAGNTSNTYLTVTGENGKRYKIKIRTRDDSNNISSWVESAEIICDTEIPEVSITNPQDQYQQEFSTSRVFGTASDNLIIKRVVLYLNSANVYDKKPTPEKTSYSIEEGKGFPIDLREGINEITFWVQDPAGNVAEETIYITYGIYTTEHFKFHFYAFTAQPATDPDNLYPHRVDETGWDVSTIEKPEGIPNYVYNFGKYFEEVSENSVKKEVKLYEKNNFNSN